VETLTSEDRRAHPFNSALETGIRALVLLEAFHPRCCDLTEMMWLDYLVVHTADIGADSPSSLHPDLPNRAGELLVRRRLVEHSLRLMHQVHMIDINDTEHGIVYSASEEVPFFLDLLQAPYTMELRQRADWLAKRFADLPSEDIKALVQDRIGRWTAEFRVGRSDDASETA
jgi:hypothetical protein